VEIFYNHILTRLVDFKTHDKTIATKLIKNLIELNSSQCFEEAA
jgi:hypothetical protein